MNISAYGQQNGASSVLLALDQLCLHMLQEFCKNPSSTSLSDQDMATMEELLDVVAFLNHAIKDEVVKIADVLFQMCKILTHISTLMKTRVYEIIRSFFKLSSSSTGYQSFMKIILTLPQDTTNLLSLASVVDKKVLLAASDVMSRRNFNNRESIWLLSQYMFLLEKSTIDSIDVQPRSTQHMMMIGDLLARAAEVIDLELEPVDLNNESFDRSLRAKKRIKIAPNTFVKESLFSIIDQSTVRNALSAFQEHSALHSTELATYLLTILRVFYKHADDIRLWLYLGPVNQRTDQKTISPIAYFWRKASQSQLVKSIRRDLRTTPALLISSADHSSTWLPPRSKDVTSTLMDWKIVLIFLELYTFILKLMDDEEFLGNTGRSDHSRLNPLSRQDVADLVSFLKNLGFSLFSQTTEISALMNSPQDNSSLHGLGQHFGNQRSNLKNESHQRPRQVIVGGVVGIDLTYIKNMVTGLLRSLYERDSRRKFLPLGHWLMTSEFDMLHFITEVVAEEERRRRTEVEDDEAASSSSGEENEVVAEQFMNSNLHRMARNQRQNQALRKSNDRIRVDMIAPKLEILQNMPFVIPFDTRVKIFREFVRLDQLQRRDGHLDADMWRQSMMFSGSRSHILDDMLMDSRLERHHANIRRKHEFEDAKEQFLSLGPALKEPIQITFVDEFDITEAGIDGGGVTKEFLNSVTSQAFHPDFGLFTTNGDYELYPMPNLLERLQEKYKDDHDLGQKRVAYNEELQTVFNSYAFAGSIIGKCLYEGILVDISFAGFFLIKWALANTVNPRTGHIDYRANINDLRDLDKGLYDGLIKLKNFEGRVEDLTIPFTIIDEITLENGTTKKIERDLVPNGANILVNNDNRLIYIAKVATHRLQRQTSLQTSAFLTGLSRIIEPAWLAMFNQSELQTLLAGTSSHFDITDLRRNTIYSGVYSIGDDGLEHPSIQLFWKAMENFKVEEIGKVLKFVTSTPRAPLLGFGSLQPKFSIRDSGEDEARFPTTSTCINLLKLPRYTSLGRLREKLLYAVNAGAGFDLS